MLRRYLIVNGITTVLLYGAFAAFVPAMPNLRSMFNTFAMQSPVLGPVIYRIVTVGGR
jgi:hypothetical protein